jgi:3-hydroxyisobutyrate dehydrogenase-like beta-hydroxyacid dehydrogenase
MAGLTGVESLGFVGFGEAAFHLAKGLREAGVKRTVAFDIHMHTPGLGEKIQQRAKETQTSLVEFSAALAATDVIISAVTADQAADAAKQAAPYLTSRHIYADLNSVSPRTKEKVAEIITRSGAHFVEIAVMGPIPPKLHKTPMLLGGAFASEFQEMFAPYGMRLDVVSTDQIGRAAAVKMFRSVIYKGLEALIFECVLGASQYGAEPRVFASLAENFPGIDWKQLADYMVGRVVVHGERRAREMDEVARTLEELGIEPMMAAATVRRMDWAADLNLRDAFAGGFPQTYQQVLDAMSANKS